MCLQWVVALLMALCLLVMAVLVGSLTQVRLRALAHETAGDLFTQVARRNAQKLQDLMSHAGSGVQFGVPLVRHVEEPSDGGNKD